MRHRAIPFLLATFTMLAANSSILLAQPNFWEQTNGPSAGGISSLVVDSSGDIFAASYLNPGVFRSTDDGDSWTQTTTGFMNSHVDVLAINTKGHIFAGGYGDNHGSVFRSIDNGESWTQIDTTLPAQGIGAIAINESGDIFAIEGEGFYRSTNNGDNWVQISGLAYPPRCLAISEVGS